MESAGATMDFDVKIMYGSSRGTEEGKVRINILYSRKDYKEDPVSGGYVLEPGTSTDPRCRSFSFMVTCNPVLLESFLGAIYDDVLGSGFPRSFKPEFIQKLALAVTRVPSRVGILGTLCIETRPVKSTVSDYTSLLKRICWGDIVKKAEGDEEEWRCAVCLETCVNDDDEVIMLHCNHMYHPRCIIGWLPRPCPTCRAPFP